MARNIKKNLGKKSASNIGRLLAVLGILLIAVMAIWISSSNKKVVHQASSTSDPAKDFNVQVDIPQGNIGELEKVPKEELDSLFANLK